MPRISKLTRQILAQNDGRDCDRLVRKLELLRTDAFAFFRGTNAFFLAQLPRSHVVFDAPRTLVCGDLHLENFGAFKGDNRLCYFDINDFDEACLAPFTIDIVRFIASVRLAGRGLGLDRARIATLVASFWTAYTLCIADGKPRWLERSLAQGVFRTLLRRAMRRTRRQLLDRVTKLKGTTRRLRVDGSKALPIRSHERKLLKSFLERLDVPVPTVADIPRKRFFKLLDAARRVAGNGSLGLERYILLVCGRGGADENFALDLKFAAPSAVAAWLGGGRMQWPTEGQRIVEVQRIMQAVAPALLHAVQFERRSFVLKELQPSVDRLNIAQWRDKPRRITQAVEGMARVAAWAHLRSCGHCGAASAEALQTYVAGQQWRRAAEKIAADAVAGVERAWAAYCKDYDSGAVRAQTLI